MTPKTSVVLRDAALTKRNSELRYLRRLVAQLKRRIAELEKAEPRNITGK